MDTTLSPERQRVRALADEYRRKGYEVIEEPSQNQLPDFLSGYRPDLLVRKGEEAIVVEVTSRASLVKESQVRELARLIPTQPNWTFELVVVGDGESLKTPDNVLPFGRVDIQRNIAEAKRLQDLGLSDAALLLAWAAIEAALRLLLKDEGIESERLLSNSILSQAVMNGLIARDEYNFLAQVMKYRNAVAHGFSTVDLDPEVVANLIRLTDQLSQPPLAA